MVLTVFDSERRKILDFGNSFAEKFIEKLFTYNIEHDKEEAHGYVYYRLKEPMDISYGYDTVFLRPEHYIRIH